MNINVTRGAVYRGRMICDMPSWTAPDTVIKQFAHYALDMDGQGFVDIVTWAKPEDLPKDWPDKMKPDVSGVLEAQVWWEATWGQKTGAAPGSGDRWKIIDYWLQKAAPEPPAICKANNISCKFDSDCCSKYCNQDVGVCAQKPINADCSEDGATCATAEECCSENCVDGICRSKTPPPKPVPVNPSGSGASSWPMIIGGLGLICGMFAAVYYVSKSSELQRNPSRRIPSDVLDLLNEMNWRAGRRGDVYPGDFASDKAFSEAYDLGLIEPIRATHWVLTEAGVDALIRPNSG